MATWTYRYRSQNRIEGKQTLNLIAKHNSNKFFKAIINWITFEHIYNVNIYVRKMSNRAYTLCAAYLQNTLKNWLEMDGRGKNAAAQSCAFNAA